GRVENCRFLHNKLSRNDTANTGNGQLWIQWASNNVVTSNSVVASADNVLLSSQDPGSNRGNVLDYNRYYATGTPANQNFALFTWNGQAYDSFSAYQHATSEDLHSVFTLM